MPKVSVIIPAYNCGGHISEAVDSVLGQTYKDIEAIIVDDGSTDNTKEALKRYEGKIRYVYQEHGGVSRARNLGISRSSGEYIAFLDADDIWVPEKLAKEMVFLEENKDAGLVACDLDVFDENGMLGETYFGRSGFEYGSRIEGKGFKSLLEHNFCNLSAVLIRKELLDRIGLFDERIVCGEDLDIFLRAAACSRIGVMPEALVRRRMYGRRTKSSSIDIDTRKENLVYIYDKVERAFPGIISKEKIDVRGLKARTYFGYGYEHFIRDNFLKARSDFRKSLSERMGWKALVFYAATFLDKRIITWIRSAKNRSTS